MRRFLTAAAVSLTFAYAVPAEAAPNDPLFADQWGLQKIQAETAWARTRGAGTIIAVVDTGVDVGHPDLSSKVIANADADFIDPNGGDGPADQNGHGTHVSGIAAAITGNGIGVAGTAPDAQILAVRVLDATGSGTADEIAAGVRYAADHNADVINLSLGFASGVDKVAKVIGAVQPVYDAIDYAVSRGAVLAIASGNDSFPYCAEPAGHPAVICVGSTDPNDLKSWFSNSDGAMIQNYVVAPGGAGTFFCEDDILSTVLRGAEGVCSPEGGYDYLAGTSMATPFVSGVVALVAARHPEFTSAQIVTCIINSTDDLGAPGRDSIYGFGRVNAAKAAAC